MSFTHFLKRFLLIWWWWGVPDWQHWKLKYIVCPQNKYHWSSRTAASLTNAHGDPLSKHLTKPRKIALFSGLCGEKAIKFSIQYSEAKTDKKRSWSSPWPQCHQNEGCKHFAGPLLFLRSLPWEMVLCCSPDYFPCDLHSTGYEQISTPNRIQGVLGWGQRVEGEWLWDLGIRWAAGRKRGRLIIWSP